MFYMKYAIHVMWTELCGVCSAVLHLYQLVIIRNIGSWSINPVAPNCVTSTPGGTPKIILAIAENTQKKRS
jgi:hypothetical protein